MIRFSLVLTAALFPFAATAETQLERLEVISEQMNDAMFDAMIRMVENEGGNPEPLREKVPDSAWNDEYRDAGACMLDRFTEASSAGAVDDMLDKMEAFIPQLANMDLDAMGQDNDFLPEGISEDFSIQVNEECGLTDLMLDRMEQSGFMAAMMQSMAGN
ncbi:hypothetical protein [Marivita hallyeonensis]|uniref:Uncharacterized protein n=1 Tax=Marivita hallyeonensis TaxID=996342 RepID=A0A1M5WX39_9RHOB|nr:hypothetical protein [Marivita hallyeonensis]SHH92169.1 hypothetical protein SAMN05443551_3577 [Marivita hallyeonensis]